MLVIKINSVTSAYADELFLRDSCPMKDVKPYLHPRSLSEVFIIVNLRHVTQLTFTCSKSTIETLEKGVKYVQSQQ